MKCGRGLRGVLLLLKSREVLAKVMVCEVVYVDLEVTGVPLKILLFCVGCKHLGCCVFR